MDKHLIEREMKSRSITSSSQTKTTRSKCLITIGLYTWRLEGNFNRVYLDRILIYPGSAVNPMTYHTLKKIEYTSNDLEFESIVIQGFNLNGQSLMGSICLTVQIGKQALCGFNLLIPKIWMNSFLYCSERGRPWYRITFQVGFVNYNPH